MEIVQLSYTRDTHEVLSETSAILQEWKNELTHSLAQRDAIQSFVAFVYETTSDDERDRVLEQSGSVSLEKLVTTLTQARASAMIKQMISLYFSPRSLRIPVLISVFLRQYNNTHTTQAYTKLASEYYQYVTKNTSLSTDTTTKKPLMRLHSVLRKSVFSYGEK